MIELEHPDFFALAQRVAKDIRFRNRPHYRLLCEVDKADPEGRLYFQVEVERPDAYTGEPGVGRGRKAYLSPYMNESELVRLAMGLLLAYDEHEAREAFEYRGRAVFGPHISIDALWTAAEHLDFREER